MNEHDGAGSASGASDSKSDASKQPSFYYTLKRTDAGGRWCGREIRIFKLKDRPYWYVAPGHGGKQDRTRLKTESRPTAVTLAVEVCDRVWSGLPAQPPRQEPTPAAPAVRELATIREVLAVYREKGPLWQKGRRTVPDNINSLRLVVREGLGKPTMEADQVDALRCDVFTDSLARRFEGGRLARTTGGEARQSVLVSINAYMRGARSILQERFQPWYADAGLLMPDVSGFMEYRLTKPKREQHKKAPRELLLKTFEQARELRKTDGPVYIAWLLAVYSLRRSEIQRCTRDWLQREVLEDDSNFLAAGEECWVIRTDRGKSDRERIIPIPDFVAEDIISWWENDSQFRPDSDKPFLVPAGRFYAESSRYVRAGGGSPLRAHGVMIRVNEWMRSLGWTTRKTLHEMRALFLRKARAEHGLEAAQALGGHADKRTTEDSYTGKKSLKGVIVEFPLLRNASGQ